MRHKKEHRWGSVVEISDPRRKKCNTIFSVTSSILSFVFVLSLSFIMLLHDEVTTNPNLHTLLSKTQRNLERLGNIITYPTQFFHNSEIICQLKEVEYTLEADPKYTTQQTGRNEQSVNSNEFPRWACREIDSPDFFYTVKFLPSHFLAEYENVIEHGNSWIRIQGGFKGRLMFLQMGYIFIPPNSDRVKVELLSPEDSRKRNEYLDSYVLDLDDNNGDRDRNIDDEITFLNPIETLRRHRNVLVVRVNSVGPCVSFTQEELSDKIFGTFGDQNNLKSQYDNCSNSKVNMFAAKGITGLAIQDGVMDIYIPFPLRFLPIDGARILTHLILTLRMGPLFPRFRHVMIVFPPSIQDNFVAFSIRYTHLSYYKNTWGGSMSAAAHEIGHNLGLKHAGWRGNVYADEVGYMGYSYESDKTPRKCFNGAYSWQLRWYADRTKVFVTQTLTEDQPCTFKLISVDGYRSQNSKKDEHFAIVKIITYGLFVQYSPIYVMFNEKKGINNETNIFPDRVNFVVSKGPFALGGSSTLLAGIQEGQEYRIRVTPLGNEIVAKFCLYNTTADPSYALMSIYKDSGGGGDTIETYVV